MNITEHVHTDDVIIRNVLWEEIVRTGQVNLKADQEAKSIVPQDAINATPMVDSNAPMKLAILEN